MEQHFIINPFTPIWWAGILGTIIISVGFIQLALRIPPDKRRLLMISIGLLQIGRELWWQWYLIDIGIWSVENSLPLHLCGIASLLSGVMMLRPTQSGFEFLALVGISGALHGFITPELVNGGNTFQIFEYYIGHGGIIFITFYLTIVEGYRLRKKSWLSTMIVAHFIVIIIMGLNYMLNINYMFLCQRPIANHPLIFGEWPWYILGFELVSISHVTISYIGFRKLKPL